MGNILFINLNQQELRFIQEALKSNGLKNIGILKTDDVKNIPAILSENKIDTIFYKLKNISYLKDLEYLKIITYDIPKIVYGERLRKKYLLNAVNVGSIFYFLEKHIKEYELITAINNALSFNKGVVDKYKWLQKRYFESQIMELNKIGIALSSEHNLKKLLNQIVLQARFLAHCDAGSLYIKDGNNLNFVVAQNDTLAKRYGEECDEKLFKKFSFPISKNRISGYVASTGQTLNIEDVYQISLEEEYTFTSDFDKRNNYLTKSMIVAAMMDSDQNIIGVLQLINCLDEEGNIIPFDKNLESLIESLASQAAVSITNARLLEKVKEAHLDTIIRLSIAAEFRDDDTAEHLKRMTAYSLIVAKNLGLSDSEIELLRYSAPMHDIGKIGTPDSILLKPGKLTGDEWEEMKKHTIYGAQILQGSDSEIMKASRIVALNHHEKWNGEGYPQGLKGNDIPIFGQIVSIADVFDALTSKRCYKKAYCLDTALKIVKESKNTQFGPQILDAFFKGLEEILDLFNKSKKGKKEEVQIILQT